MPQRSSWRTGFAVVVVVSVVTSRPAASAGPEKPNEYLAYIRSQAAVLHAGDAVPTSRTAWEARDKDIRAYLLAAWGGFPASPCPLEPRVLGTLRREGYRVERLVFQTRPGLWMTANAYVPAAPGRHPALLNVHGHWHGAKQDPIVQARCIGAVKLGFFVLVVDALGAGERGIGKTLGEYHGEMTAATLLPVGLPLSGLQVYENMRAVDYLRTRPEVDGTHIGITGASGGGNQTMYAGAWDERLAAAVPVCSVGNYQAYLGAACCMCEVVPGALRFTEECGVLGLTAPRGLMVINASRDAVQFSVAEAKTSLARVAPVYGLYGQPGNLRHTVFESGHDYSRPMREAMYGWMTLHLKGQGDGLPISEPEIKTEDPETLRCYPGDSRPADWMTIPRLAAAEGRKLLAAHRLPTDRVDLEKELEARRKALVERVLGGFPSVPPVAPRVETLEAGRVEEIHFSPEPGLNLTARVEQARSKAARLAILLDLEGANKARTSRDAAMARKQDMTVVTLDLRATGSLAVPGDAIGKAPDHNSAEWALWIGRPLLGQWVFDVRRLLDAIEKVHGALPSEVILSGKGPAGLVALATGAIDPRVKHVDASEMLASYLGDGPYVGQRLGVMAPGMLREVGDVADLAVLCAPRLVIVNGGVAADGKSLPPDQLLAKYREAERVWSVLRNPNDVTRTLMVCPSGK